MTQPSIHWYFDFISPFAYLQSTRLNLFADRGDLVLKPVLFAALLDHWGHLGPAEIPTKRQWTFEHVQWLADRHGIPLALPPMHPFVPLRLLRLSILLGNRIDVVQRLFAFVWREGKLPTNDEHFLPLLGEYGISLDDLEQATVKNALREHTQAAIAAGVFGVPTVLINAERFWGFDATDMVLARLAGDPFFDSEALQSARRLPQGIARKRP